jgi:hypothetical protein
LIEGDKLNGPNARNKQIYTVDLPRTAAAPGPLRVLPKTLAYDVLPDVRATNGWTQESSKASLAMVRFTRSPATTRSRTPPVRRCSCGSAPPKRVLARR